MFGRKRGLIPTCVGGLLCLILSSSKIIKSCRKISLGQKMSVVESLSDMSKLVFSPWNCCSKVNLHVLP